MMNKLWIFFIYGLVSLVCISCSSKTTGYGPNFSFIDWSIQKIVVIKPDLYAFEVSGGGIPEFRVDWSESAEKNISETMITQLKKFRYEGIPFTENDSSMRIDSITSFVKNVATAINSNLYGASAFLPQIDSFTYSTGSLTDLCDYYGTNAAMFIFGADEHYSQQRIEVLKRSAALKTAKSMFWSTISMLLFGGASFRTYSIMPERTLLCCVVADRSGKIIWYKQYYSADGLNLSIPADAMKVTEQIVTGFNRRKKQ
jgi:hypothetical protein